MVGGDSSLIFKCLSSRFCPTNVKTYHAPRNDRHPDLSRNILISKDVGKRITKRSLRQGFAARNCGRCVNEVSDTPYYSEVFRLSLSRYIEG